MHAWSECLEEVSAEFSPRHSTAPKKVLQYTLLVILSGLLPSLVGADPLQRVALNAGTQQGLEQHIIWDWLRRENLPLERLSVLRANLYQHFMASPSVVTFAMYGAVLTREQLSNGGEGTDRPPVAEFEQMKKLLSRDFSKEAPYTPVFGGINVYDTGAGRFQLASKGTPFFKSSTDVLGWIGSGEPSIETQRGSKSGDYRYSVALDEHSLAMLSPVYEFAKRLRQNVTVKLGKSEFDELAQSDVAYDVNSGTIDTTFTAYAITPGGLVEGRFVSEGYFGDPCAGQETSAEFSFSKPIEPSVLGYFASAIPVDIAKAKVSIERANWLDFYNMSFSDSVIYRVDLDNNSTVDIYGVAKTDGELGDEGMGTDIFSLQLPTTKPKFVQVAGWYANDYQFIDANINGHWLRLSKYNVVTCT